MDGGIQPLPFVSFFPFIAISIHMTHVHNTLGKQDARKIKFFPNLFIYGTHKLSIAWVDTTHIPFSFFMPIIQTNYSQSWKINYLNAFEKSNCVFN